MLSREKGREREGGGEEGEKIEGEKGNQPPSGVSLWKLKQAIRIEKFLRGESLRGI